MTTSSSKERTQTSLCIVVRQKKPPKLATFMPVTGSAHPGLKERDLKLAFNMFDDVCGQVQGILEDNHSHFLHWTCFVVCLPEGDDRLNQDILKFVKSMTSRSLTSSDPRNVIQKILHGSPMREHIALVLLGIIIDDFRQRCSLQNAEMLKLLAQLFDHLLDQEDKLTSEDVEPVLQQWAKASCSVAELIHADALEPQLRGPGVVAISV